MNFGLLYRPSNSMYYLSINGDCTQIWHGDTSPETQALARAEAGRRMLVIDPDFDESEVDGVEVSVLSE